VKKLHEQIKTLIGRTKKAYKEKANKNRKAIEYQLGGLL